MYTQTCCLYPLLNSALRDHAHPENLKAFLPYLKLLLKGLNKLPLLRKQVYRGVNVDLHEEYNQLQGRTFRWWAFSSTSQGESMASDFLGGEGESTLFKIDGIGVDIAAFSAHPESEVTLLPDTLTLTLTLINPNPNRYSCCLAPVSWWSRVSWSKTTVGSSRRRSGTLHNNNSSSVNSMVNPTMREGRKGDLSPHPLDETIVMSPYSTSSTLISLIPIGNKQFLLYTQKELPPLLLSTPSTHLHQQTQTSRTHAD